MSAVPLVFDDHRAARGIALVVPSRLPPGDQTALEALARDMMRPPVSLARLQVLTGGDEVVHFPKGSGDDPGREARAHRLHRIRRTRVSET